MRLPERLQSLLDLCEPGLPLWDLCCDHGLLGIAALESGQFSEVIFNDSVPHVIEQLSERLAGRARCRTVLAFAEDIGEELTGNLILAGVGGEKIFKILSNHSRAGRLRARHVIACPEKHAAWLGDQELTGYTLREQRSIPHNHTTRRILHFIADT